MKKQLILPSQKTSIFQDIINKDLTPAEFEWTENEGKFTKYIISVLTHRPTGFFYEFEIKDERHYSIFSPGATLFIEEQFPGSWDNQVVYLRRWLTFLKREVESPDLWRAISQESELINATNSESENTPFNEEEKKNIISGLNEIRHYLTEVHKIDSELIEPRLKYLEESSQRLGRKDWINILFSVVIGIILNATVTPESSREILRFVGNVLHKVLQNLLLLN